MGQRLKLIRPNTLEIYDTRTGRAIGKANIDLNTLKQDLQQFVISSHEAEAIGIDSVALVKDGDYVNITFYGSRLQVSGLDKTQILSKINKNSLWQFQQR